MTVASLADTLHAGLEELGLALSPQQEASLLAYLDLLVKWNKVYNLTAVREPEAMVTQHLLDSLSVLPHLGEPATLVDVGAGAGLPGIPLAIARPGMRVLLVDSSHKKTSFMQQVLVELGLVNASVLCDRVEHLHLPAPADAAISRAFSDLREFVRLARHLVAPGGRLLAMKGLYPHEELGQLPADVTLREVIPLRVPGLAAQRHLVVMEVG
ncbi:MAG: 16S rRNA (guanine(527)-N(7))-methyltransferase RsmG [Burkholderiales bacterium]